MVVLSLASTHLLLVVLNKCGLHHVDTVFTLNFFTIMQQELLVSAHFLLDWLNWNLVDSCSNLKCLHRVEKLFGYVQDIF